MPPTGENATLRLPLTFDVTQLRADTDRCLRSGWRDHVNQRMYAGEWTSIALRSPSGEVTDIASVPGIEGYRDTALLDECPYFRAVVDRFECGKESVRLLRLAAGSVIHEHRDPGASYADGFFRVHIPVTTNAATEFVVGGHDLRMQPGECWYADFGLPHRVRNGGDSDRIHLVLDCLRNAWSDAVFREAGYDFAADARARQMDPATRRMIIASLRARGTDVDLRLADELEAGGV